MKRSHVTKDRRLDGLYTLGPGMDRPETNVEERQRMKQLLRLGMETSLTSRQREIMQLYFFEDMKPVKIASDLGISRQAVHKTIRQAIKKLEVTKKFLKV